MKTTEEMMNMLGENGINIENFYGTITVSFDDEENKPADKFLCAGDIKEHELVHVLRILTNKFYSKKKQKWVSGMNAFIRENLTLNEIWHHGYKSTYGFRGSMNLSGECYFRDHELREILEPSIKDRETRRYEFGKIGSLNLEANRVDWEDMNNRKIDSDVMDKYKGCICDEALLTLFNRYSNLLNDPEGKYTKEKVKEMIKTGIDEGKYYIAYKILNDMVKEGVIRFED